MDSSKGISGLLKVLGVLTLDAIVFILVFSIWAIINLPVFPWALLAIFFSLILVNTGILASRTISRLLGTAAYASAMMGTIGYFLLIFIFTWSTYWVITPRGYVIASLILFLLYALLMSGLSIAGFRRVEDISRDGIERTKTESLALSLMGIEEEITRALALTDSSTVALLKQASARTIERLQASTPFGRVERPAPLEMENRIISALSSISMTLKGIEGQPCDEATIAHIVAAFEEIEALVRNRERLIVQ